MRVVTIVQARMGSTRLPGKVLMPLGGRLMLAHVIARAARAKKSDELIVATSALPADDAIASFCESQQVRCFRGDESDVLDRYHEAAKFSDADAIVRITADCPLIDPEVCDRVISDFLTTQPATDYACNFFPQRTYPRGLDVEILRADVLDRCWREAEDHASREHVTAFIYAHPESFEIRGVQGDEDHSDMRWTVDTLEDMEFARRIYEHFGHDRFTSREVIDALGNNPDWSAINAHIPQKTIA